LQQYGAAADGAVLYMNSSPLLVSTDSTMYADIAVAADAVAAVDDTDECIELLHTATTTVPPLRT
jgi:hypothetical protein